MNSKYLRLHKEFNQKRVRGGGYVGILDEDKRLIRTAVVDAAMYDTNIFEQAEEAATLEDAPPSGHVRHRRRPCGRYSNNMPITRASRQAVFMASDLRSRARDLVHSNYREHGGCVSGMRVMCTIINQGRNLDRGVRLFSFSGDRD